MAGTIAALGGVYLKARLDRAEKAQDRAWGAQRDATDLRQIKAEELYIQFDTLSNCYTATYVAYKGWLAGRIPGKVLLELIDKYNLKYTYSISTTKFILDAYFPHLVDGYSEISSKLSAINEFIKTFDIAQAYEKSKASSPETQAKFEEMTADIRNSQLEFARRIARQVRNPE